MLHRFFQKDKEESPELIHPSRRQFIKQMSYGSLLTLAAPTAALAASHHGHGHAHTHHHKTAHAHAHKPHAASRKTLAFEHAHTGDKLKLTYFEKGHYVKSALKEINFILRDFRTGDIYPIDIALLDQLHDIKQMLNVQHKPFHIISGYRSPVTNSWLHNETSGVANNSLHMQGKAIDIRIEGVQSHHIRNAALALAQGGVGYYPDSDFVHIDTGRVRTW